MADDELKLDIKGFHKKGRYAVTQKGYVFDRRLFKILSVVVVVIVFSSFMQLGGFKQYAYASCPADSMGGYCENPLYGLCDKPACQPKTLRPGQTIGEQPPSLNTTYFFIFTAAALTFLINHYGQNNKAYEVARNERNSDKRINRQRQKGPIKTPARQKKRRPKK